MSMFKTVRKYKDGLSVVKVFNEKTQQFESVTKKVTGRYEAIKVNGDSIVNTEEGFKALGIDISSEIAELKDVTKKPKKQEEVKYKPAGVVTNKILDQELDIDIDADLDPELTPEELAALSNKLKDRIKK